MDTLRLEKISSEYNCTADLEINAVQEDGGPRKNVSRGKKKWNSKDNLMFDLFGRKFIVPTQSRAESRMGT